MYDQVQDKNSSSEILKKTVCKMKDNLENYFCQNLPDVY
ncbi:hypothetical protein BH11BAC3_BH11BAC3_36110 [soil metagenome]